MNDRQIAFIMCVNDDRQADESEFYIRCLEVPEQYEVDVIRVREAESMTAGYNAAMENSDARYICIRIRGLLRRNLSEI